MGTRLEQLQAATKAKTAAGQPISAQPIAAPVAVKPGTPTVGAVTAAVSQPKAATAPVSGTASSVKNASAIPATQSAVKSSVTTPTAAIGALAGVSAGMPKPTAPVTAQAPTAAVAQPNTNYVQQGGKTLNDLLYLKKSYESGKTGAAAYAGQYYNQLDPNTAAAVKSMNAAQLEQYIAGLGSGNATAAQIAPQEAMQVTPAIAAKDYNALAQAQYDRELAAMLAGAQSQETELKRRYEYANGVTQDNRQLETAMFNRNNAPTAWDGSTGYQAAQMDRNRSIEDHYTGEALKDNVAAAYSQANALRGQVGNYLTTAANQLQTADQQLAMQEAGLTGVYKGQQTMQGAANAASLAGQNIANQMAQIELQNYPETTRLKLRQLQQQVNAGSISNQTAAYQLQQLTDPNSVTNQAASLELAMKQIDASNYSETQKLQLEQLRKTVEQIGKVQPVSDYELRMQALDLQKAELQLQELQTGKTAETAKAEDYISSIDKIAVPNSNGVLKNPDQVESYIVNSPLSEYEMYRLYGMYGLKWEGAIPSPE